MGVLNNKFKDVVFCKLFGSEEYKDNLLSLFNALNNTEYDNPDDLQINTIGNSVFMGMKNDLSCILDSYMELFEEQSTVNPNAPVRGMLYFSRLYETYIDENDAYRFGSKLVRLPTPRYFVLYLGKEERPDKEILRLSKAFIHPLVEADYEWTATVLNVNIGHNKALLAACRVLKEYSQFVECSRRHLTAVAVEFKKKYSEAGNKGVAGKSSKTADGNKSLHSNSREIQTDSKEILWYRTSEYQEAKYRAMIEAVDECIRNNILRDFLIRNKAEVVGMYLTEWDEEAAKKVWRQESFEDGKIEGKIEGQDELNELIQYLLRDNRIADLKRSTIDKDFQNTLLAEYAIGSYGKVTQTIKQ